MLTIHLVGKVFRAWPPRLKKHAWCSGTQCHAHTNILGASSMCRRTVMNVWDAGKIKVKSLPTGSYREDGETDQRFNHCAT